MSCTTSSTCPANSRGDDGGRDRRPPVAVDAGAVVAHVMFTRGLPSRLGFGAAIEQGFRKPSLRIPDAAFQAMRLPAYESWMSGTLVYAETFWNHDAVGLRHPHPQ